MNVAGIPLLAFLALSIAAALVVKFSPSPFVFSLFNALILAVILGNYRPPGDEVGGVWPSFQVSYGEEEEEDVGDDAMNNDSSDDDNGGYGVDCGSDGYDTDDEDDGSEDEIGWGDEEERDDNLDTRIEDFIAKVVNGWREEWLNDKLQNR